MKKQTRKQKFGDLFTAYKCIKENKPMKRDGAKDGSVPTHSVVVVPEYPESEVLKFCLDWLRKHRILCNRNNTGAGNVGTSGFYSYGIRGAGDVVGLNKRGVHFEIEFKRGKGGRLSIGQQKRLKDIRKNNGIYLVIHGTEELEYYNDKYHYFD